MSERLFRFGQAYQACNIDWSSCELRSLGLTRLDEYACGFSYVVPGFSSKDQKKWRSTGAPASCKKLETTEIQSYGSFYFSPIFFTSKSTINYMFGWSCHFLLLKLFVGCKGIQLREIAHFNLETGIEWCRHVVTTKKHMKCTICTYIHMLKCTHYFKNCRTGDAGFFHAFANHL